ncbi:type 1 glutamine amidotransferase [Alicyclobacillus tolerans]|uniref:Lipid II isoglutaminyl synthase (glutamine-hydrolyzing) subunit GatD n=2 Tax=Alicyclobacillus tolerans TaxID=90970 RepID=A0ABT9LTD0_9BACL|nr:MULTISPECIES: glutamine amidotransferase [Alicyclobacillus]MDP9727515.1 CobQ-like glutamine amidotransferase family enzyme [Alicyclobacillus tengchongensis]QRF23956.1 glutamine amidotransferase [Alicyclobacillus sp. TC]SHJ98058.1 hypothetical protein SAMN05443507_106131 [Alicyclobacillus montanus]
MSRALIIAHLYPDLLNLYADRGNIQTLLQRLRWRGIEARVVSVKKGEPVRLHEYDFVLLGGGSDREQKLVAESLRQQKEDWHHAMQAGLPILAVCGGYQLLGSYYELANSEKVAGLELLEMTTQASNQRLIGNIAIESEWCGTVVGFENHAGRTVHHHTPLGKVVAGHGNNGRDGWEGVQHHHVIGTYIHGPLLPKNPKLADLLLLSALEYANMTVDFYDLDDELEWSAHHSEWSRWTKVK